MHYIKLLEKSANSAHAGPSIWLSVVISVQMHTANQKSGEIARFNPLVP